MPGTGQEMLHASPDDASVPPTVPPRTHKNIKRTVGPGSSIPDDGPDETQSPTTRLSRQNRLRRVTGERRSMGDAALHEQPRSEKRNIVKRFVKRVVSSGSIDVPMSTGVASSPGGKSGSTVDKYGIYGLPICQSDDEQLSGDEDVVPGSPGAELYPWNVPVKRSTSESEQTEHVTESDIKNIVSSSVTPHTQERQNLLNDKQTSTNGEPSSATINNNNNNVIKSNINEDVKQPCDNVHVGFISGVSQLHEDNQTKGDHVTTNLDSTRPNRKSIFAKPSRPSRYAGNMWADMPKVLETGILDTMSGNDRKLQEAMFEILKSEESFLKSLNDFINVYLLSEEFGLLSPEKNVLSRQEHHVIFSNITTVRDTSERFLDDLETLWQDTGLLDDVCDVITEYAKNHFESYIVYCSNQKFQDKKLEELKKNARFMEAIGRLQTHEACQRLPMVSFLVLPMQRITRLPLLVSAILKYIDPAKERERYSRAVETLGIVNQVVAKCNERAKKMQQAEEILLISKQIFFKDVTPIPLESSSRHLVKKGDVTWVSLAGTLNPKSILKRKKQIVHLVLFNDILLITKKNGERYQVIDYAERPMLLVETFDEPMEDLTSSMSVGQAKTRFLPPGVPNTCVNLFQLMLLENHKQKRQEYIFECNSENGRSDRARWIEAFTPAQQQQDTEETIYEEWDCPQVLCLRRYQATEPDELTLEESDVVKVFRKLEDGMYEGERIRDGQRGWFPKEYTVEVNDAHARARNLRMQYQLSLHT